MLVCGFGGLFVGGTRDVLDAAGIASIICASSEGSSITGGG
jgi:hypothetical protein